MSHRSGFAAVLGKTNVGKSTFINAVLGRRVVIVSDRPQTTRNRIRCVYTTDGAQIIFVDTPGLHRPVNELSQRLIREAFRSLAGVDVLLYMIEPWGKIAPYDEEILPRLATVPSPRILVVNKTDQAKGNALPETLLAYEATGLFDELVPVSSVRGQGLDTVVDLVIERLPEGPPLFPPDMDTDRPIEFLVAELIREKVYQLTYQEIPYATAVVVEHMAERTDRPLIDIHAVLYLTRDSQKPILIGKGGTRLKEIGRRARTELELLLGKQVFLQLTVKVRPGWTKDEKEIARLSGD